MFFYHQHNSPCQVNIVRILAGTMCTSLDMKGISVSVLRVDTYSEGQDALLSLLDAPTNVCGCSMVVAYPVHGCISTISFDIDICLTWTLKMFV